MSVLEKFKDFCLELKGNREWKEEKCRFKKNEKSVSFVYKKHILDVSIFVVKDKRTYIIEEEGTKKITDEEWKLFYQNIQDEEALIIFKGINKEYEKAVAFGEKAKKIKELYDEVLLHKKKEYGMDVTMSEMKVNIEGRVYPVELIFEWEKGTITLLDKARRLNKTFSEKEAIGKYLK